MADSSDRTKVALIASVLLFACIGFSLAGAYVQHIHSVGFFSDALRSARVTEQVVVQGISYDVVNGAVSGDGTSVGGAAALPALRLAYALTIARRSPVFGLDGTDPKQLDNAVSLLVSVQEGFAKLQRTSTSSALVSSSLYPIHFLRSLVTLEGARQTFLKDGSDTDLSTYMSAQQTTLSAFKNDLQQFRTGFERAVPAKALEYGTTAGVIDRNSSLAAMDGLRHMAAVDESLLQRRTLCFSGVTLFCDATDIALPVLSAVAPSRQSFSPEFINNVLNIYTEASGKDPARQVVEIAQGSCIRDVDAPPIYALYPFNGFGTSILFPVFMGDILLIQASQYSDLPYYQYYLDHGIQYVVWRPSTHYTCPDFDTDLGATFATTDVQETATKHPLSALASKADAVGLAHLETALVTPKDGVLRETDARAYVTLGREMVEKGTLPPEAADTIASLSLRLEKKSAKFDYMVYRMASTEKIDTEILKKGATVELGTPYLFYVRSAFFSLFLGAEERPETYRSPVNTTIPLTSSQLPLLHYSQNPDITRTELVSDMRFFFTLHQSK